MIQKAFLYQIYSPATTTPVGAHVAVFNGALGDQTLNKWDPTEGYYANGNDCEWGTEKMNAECDYTRVQHDLVRNGYSEAQVQAIFIKSSNPFPQCDLKRLYCGQGSPPPTPDAYRSEKYLGNILRYLKCCTLDQDGHSTGLPRYPYLKQVFITSRIYGGYADPLNHGCLMPEPFAYEEGFAVQRLVVNQMNQVEYPDIPITDEYAGSLDYDNAPWFDWGPYLWASGETPRNFDLLNWCNGQTGPNCAGRRDVRDGDIFGDPVRFCGDHVHPSAQGAEKVANQLVKFTRGLPQGGSPFVQAWIQR